MTNRTLAVASSLIVFVLPLMEGCAIYRPKPPVKRSILTDQMLNDVAAKDLLDKYNAMSDGKPSDDDPDRIKKVARRNQILRELIFLIDQNYYSFESHFYGSQAVLNVGGDFVNLGLTGVTSVTGSAHLKSVLSALATGTTGLKTSVDKNFFDQQTRAAIVQKMRAGRASQLAILQDEDHMKAGLTKYSLETGLADVYTYYDEGTLVGALQAIAKSAGDDQKKAADQQKTNSSKSQLMK
jgi:hypothetical protein